MYVLFLNIYYEVLKPTGMKNISLLYIYIIYLKNIFKSYHIFISNIWSKTLAHSYEQYAFTQGSKYYKSRTDHTESQ